MTALLRHRAARQHVCSDACIHDAGKQSDPTNTFTLRRRYKSKIDGRWSQLRIALRGIVVDQNALHLKSASRNLAPRWGEAGVADATTLKAFQRWVDDALGRIILENEAAYMKAMVADTYMTSVNRAITITNTVPVKILMNAERKISALHQLTVMEIQGIMEAVSQQIVRSATNALLNGKKPRATMREMARIIQSVGVVRSRMLVNFMVIKTFGEGTLDAFAEAGIKQVATVPEFIVSNKPVSDGLFRDAPRRLRRKSEPSARTLARIRRAERKLEKTVPRVDVVTAGDDDVCPICEDISDNGPYSIDTARSLIPAHPNCRCAFVPA